MYDPYDEYDTAQDEFIGDLYADFAREVLNGRDELYSQVLEQFTGERLQSYYLANPTVAEPALAALEEAAVLLPDHPSAALVFGVTATDVGLKSTLLKPILHGLTHEESFGALLAELIPDQRNDKFQKLLFGILKEFAGIDLRIFKRAGQKQTFWEEVATIQQIRNGVVHRGEIASTQQAERATEVAAYVLNDVFPTVISKVGLHTHDRLHVSAGSHANVPPPNKDTAKLGM